MHLPLGKFPEQQQNKLGSAKARAFFVFLCFAFAVGVFVPSHEADAAIKWVQDNAVTGQTTVTASVAFVSNNSAGNLIVVGWITPTTAQLSR
jgi:hypothetical protein